MKNEDKVSIIIPAYNCEKTIKEAILSAQNQTYELIEIIVINDGSTDETEQIVNEIAKKDDRIRSYFQSNNGVSAARNAGLKYASGKYITFLDADDILKNDAIQKLVESSENADIVISGIHIFMKNSRGKSRETEYTHRDVYLDSNMEIWGNFYKLFYDNCLNSPCARLYKKSVIDEYTIKMDTDLEMGEDLQFNLLFLEYAESLKVVSGTVYIYNTYQSFLSKKKTDDLFEKRKKSVVLLEGHLRNHDLDGNIVYFMFLKLMISQVMQERKNGKKYIQRKKIIEKLIEREEIKISIDNYHPEGVLGNALKTIIATKNIHIIDAFAGFCLIMNSWLQHFYRRVSV